MRSLYKQQPQIRRFPYLFDQTLSCVASIPFRLLVLFSISCQQYVLGSIASKPQIHLALSALTNLELAYDLYDATLYDDTPRRTKILVGSRLIEEFHTDISQNEIDKLRERARLALNVSQSPLDDMQKLVRPKNANTSLKEKSQHSSLPADVPTGPIAFEVSSHQYSPTVNQSVTYAAPQHSSHPSSDTTYQMQQQSSTQPQVPRNPFLEHLQMAYKPISGYQYYDYQDASYFQQQMECEPGYHASGDTHMPMLAESWQIFINQIRQ